VASLTIRDITETLAENHITYYV